MCHWKRDKRYNIIGGSYAVKFLQLSMDQNLGSLPSINKHSINTWLTLHWHLGWQLAETQLIFDGCIHIWVGQHMAGYWPIVDLMLLWARAPWNVDQVLSKCWPSIVQDVHRVSKCWSGTDGGYQSILDRGWLYLHLIPIRCKMSCSWNPNLSYGGFCFTFIHAQLHKFSLINFAFDTPPPNFGGSELTWISYGIFFNDTHQSPEHKGTLLSQ